MTLFGLRLDAFADHPERTGDDAVAAAVANIVLNDDRAELRENDRARRTDVEAAGVRAMLADVGFHQPTAAIVVELLDEGDVTPRSAAKLAGVVVRHAGEGVAVLRKLVPLFAGDFAGLAPDAERRIGEEAAPIVHVDALPRNSSKYRRSSAPRGRLPARISHVRPLVSWMWTLGSSAMCSKSLALSPVTMPLLPQ